LDGVFPHVRRDNTGSKFPDPFRCPLKTQESRPQSWRARNIYSALAGDFLLAFDFLVGLGLCGFGGILSIRFKTSSRVGESGSEALDGLDFVIPATCFLWGCAALRVAKQHA
jgi:hypothetical protein